MGRRVRGVRKKAGNGKELIELDSSDAEVWSWRKLVRGTCRCKGGGSAVSLTVNGRQVEADCKGEEFEALVPLQEGKNRVSAFCSDGDRGGRSPECITLTQRLKSRPTARISVSIDSRGVTFDGSGSSPSEASGAPITRYGWRRRSSNPVRLRTRRRGGGGSPAELLVAAPSRDGEYYVSLRVTDAEGKSDTAASYFVVENGDPRLVNAEREHACWVDTAVVYGVVPHNFGSHGLRSVTDRLDWLEDLGISALWLAPCNATPWGGHGYHVTDYFKIRRDYGTKADFRRLVKEAHARDIRVLMDVAPNHCSIRHRYMVDAQKHGEASPYYDFFDRDEDTGDHTHYFHWRHLPNLNYDNPEVRRWMMEALSYWVREFDVDGFRVDAAWGVKLRRPDFWPECRAELKRIKPDILLLAEASARDPYWFTNGFDAAYDWTQGLGQWAMRGVFTRPEGIARRLRSALTNKGRGYHEDALIFRFLNNNDTGPRFITRFGREMEKVAAVMLLTLPGLPCIYTGQEVGAEFEPYGTPGPIGWKDRHGLRDYYKELIRLRKEIPALHSRRWEILKMESAQEVLAYVRYGGPEDEPVLVVLNFSPEKASARIWLNESCQLFGRRGSATDVLQDRRVRAQRSEDGGIRVSLPASSARVLVGS
jgi:glycosidase